MKGRKAVVALLTALVLSVACACEVKPKAVVGEPTVSREQAIQIQAERRNVTLSETQLAEAKRQMEQDLAEYRQLNGEAAMAEIDLDELWGLYQQEALSEALMAVAVPKVRVKRAESKQWYEERYAALEKTFAEDPGVFKSQQDYYDLYGGVPPLIVPSGYVRVKHILVSDAETADALHAQLQAGADFTELMEAYGTDPGMVSEPYRTLGYLVGPYESTRDYLKAFKQAALALKNVGDISPVAQTASGCHILQLTEIVQPKTLSFQQAKDAIRALLEKQARKDRFEELVQQWMIDPNA